VVVVNHLDRRLWFDKCPYQATYPTKVQPAKKFKKKMGTLCGCLFPNAAMVGMKYIAVPPGVGVRSSGRIGVRSSVFWLLTTSH
jgi:hypothetical protein